jgi:hypothetical protein
MPKVRRLYEARASSDMHDYMKHVLEKRSTCTTLLSHPCSASGRLRFFSEREKPHNRGRENPSYQYTHTFCTGRSIREASQTDVFIPQTS